METINCLLRKTTFQEKQWMLCQSASLEPFSVIGAVGGMSFFFFFFFSSSRYQISLFLEALNSLYLFKYRLQVKLSEFGSQKGIGN